MARSRLVQPLHRSSMRQMPLRRPGFSSSGSSFHFLASKRRSVEQIANANIRANLWSMQVGTLSQQPGTVCDFPCVPARLSVICRLENIRQENISKGDSDEPRHEKQTKKHKNKEDTNNRCSRGRFQALQQPADCLQ